MSEYDSMLRAAQAFLSRPLYGITAEAVARRAVDTGSCVMHASRELYVEAIDAGLVPVDTCSHCGGRNRAGAGDHNLCAARAALGMPTTEVLDGSVSPCACHPCTLAREALWS